MGEMEKFKGCIVEESLIDNRVLNDIEITKLKIAKDERPSKRWHIYNVLLDEEKIKELQVYLKDKWYMHFWNDEILIVVFKNEKFVVEVNEKETWKPAIDYGISIGIPKEQLDFVME